MMKIFSAKELLSSFFLLLLLYPSSHSLDNITPTQPIKDGDVLVSNNMGTFALGFFSPGNSRSRYVGIWYNKVSPQTVVWVANRDTPLNDTSGVLSINNHGNLVLHHNTSQNLNPIWSSNVSVSSSNASAKLLDTGNLVLSQSGNNNNNVLWQSFDYPGNTMLPFMKLGLDRKTGLNRFLTSWKSPNDPGSGNFTDRIDPTVIPQAFVYNNKDPLWRIGSWTGMRWSGSPEMNPSFIINNSFIDDADEVSILYRLKDSSNTVLSRVLLDETGHLRRFIWQANEPRWHEIWFGPKDECDNFRWCGSNTNCNPYNNNPNNFQCECLPGFEPKSPREWYLKDGSGGCVRKRNVSTCRSGEGFVKVERVKVPETSKVHVDKKQSMEECMEKCLRDCSCAAYTSANGSSESGCVTWHGDMEDTRTFAQVGQNLFVRVDAVELAKYAKNPGSLGKKKLVAILVGSICFLFFVVSFVYWFVKGRKQANYYKKSIAVFSKKRLVAILVPSVLVIVLLLAFCVCCMWKRKGKDKIMRHLNQDSPREESDVPSRTHSNLPFFSFKMIMAATKNFAHENKLGQGGFGSVYKGCLINGQDIAVKRLSKDSGQGTEEFKNEVTLLVKLQHRNLVRLLGCCFEKDEKMLVYEYLPNKSLDFFIFEETQRSSLDWGKRFEIIFGIARGVLYLHQDSRLKIIHRDLKASNVLLGAAMNPKISDFGMARIFGEDQIQARTRRVVGTYGYMSPEYAMEGRYSTKSDVFSFGVLLLEIIAGKRNTDCVKGRASPNLIGHVWILWKEGRALDIVDSTLGQSYPPAIVLRCIQIGLLCVQENAINRPSMLEVVFMLGNETPLGPPQKPAFLFNGSQDLQESSTSGGGSSINEVTATTISAR